MHQVENPAGSLTTPDEVALLDRVPVRAGGAATLAEDCGLFFDETGHRAGASDHQNALPAEPGVDETMAVVAKGLVARAGWGLQARADARQG